jgi:hypothetical protein
LPFFSARFSVLPPRRFSAFFSVFFSTLRDALHPYVYWLFCVSAIFLPHATNRTACPYSLRFMRVFLIFSTGFCTCDNYGITMPFSGFYGKSMPAQGRSEELRKVQAERKTQPAGALSAAEQWPQMKGSELKESCGTHQLFFA